MKKQIVFTKESFVEKDTTVEVLVIQEGLEHLDMSDDKCCLCGLKIRNGKHSWLVHKLNGNINGMLTLLPVEPQSLWHNYEISQGGSAIGSECRKQLPAEYVINTTSWVTK
jgi:hypothetical protein